MTKTQFIRRDDRPVCAALLYIEMDGTPEASRQTMSIFLAVVREWSGFRMTRATK